MSKQEPSPLHRELIQGGKKLSKRKQHLLERLQKARESKERAEERLQRMQARMQKRSARVQRLEERLTDICLQSQEGDTVTHTINLDVSFANDIGNADVTIDELSSQEHSDKAIEPQALEDINITSAQRVDLAALSESIVQAQDARYDADVAEETVRRAVERVQAAESRLDQFGTARHLEYELAHMRLEINQALQLAQEKELAARQAEQLILPFKLLTVDE
jgi:chromosome segregation ATPase